MSVALPPVPKSWAPCSATLANTEPEESLLDPDVSASSSQSEAQKGDQEGLGQGSFGEKFEQALSEELFPLDAAG
eukprot:2755318-Alexandrium_andersonii.AAC.1